jgi:hypothetical protein
MKNPGDGHAAVDGPITQDRTRVFCKKIDGKYVAMAPIHVPMPPISQSLTQVMPLNAFFCIKVTFFHKRQWGSSALMQE